MSKSVARSIFAIFFARLAINVTRRFPYPFVSPIGAAFGLPANSIQNIIALTNGAGLFSPLFGTLSERYGKKTVMLGALVMMTAMSLLGALFADYGVFVLVMFGFGVGKIIYDPTFQAYIGDVIHFSRRARVMGIAELSWALSLVIAAPVAGFLLDVSSLQAIFAFLAILLGTSAIVFWLLVEAAPEKRRQDRPRIMNPLSAMRAVSAHPPSVFALIFTVCLTASHEIFYINYGLWMEDSFGLVLTALGAVTIVIAAAEVIGELIVITLADRFGTKRTTMCGMLIAAALFLIVPYLSFSLPAAMFGVFLIFISIEAAIVSALPLFSEILPQARAVMMSANVGAHSLGRVAGGALGAVIYKFSDGNFLFIGLVAGGLGILAFLIMFRLVPAGESSPS
ncbi:MAG: MFS transporter [Chloroflexi bacterium]|nr:MFS transporter [Chloroflexota bacterium]